MMNVQQAITYIKSANGGKMRLGLSRVRELLRRLGDVQETLRFVHVAGSNGKGSTCAMIESILRTAGYKTGLFTSPAVFDFREHIRVRGEWIGEEALCTLTEQVRAAAAEMDDQPTQYELLTALAILHFAREGCEVVVLEAALGGRDDCTNVIGAPLAAVITSVCLEHTKILGATLGEIAAVKADIIKHGCSAICCENDGAVMEAVARRCAQVDAPLRIASCNALTPLGGDLTAQRFSYRGKVYTLPLLGAHQLANAAAALAAVGVLRERGLIITDDAISQGLASVKWGARFEILRREPLFILDGGHNPQCAAALASTLSAYFPCRKFTFIMGVLADKSLEAMVQSVLPHAERFFCVTPDNPRALDAQALADVVRAGGGQAEVFGTVCQAAVTALRAGTPACAFGSLYMMGEVKRCFSSSC